VVFLLPCSSLLSLRDSLTLRFLIVGGSAPEIEVALGLEAESKNRTGMDAFIFRRYGEAFEVIPYTLAEVLTVESERLGAFLFIFFFFYLMLLM
jgi:chaperonin GroEL (HSP60 family)